MSSAPSIALLEELSMNAWPAERVHCVDGWRLRATLGVTRRANSVWPNRPEGDTTLADRVDGAERFYTRLGLATCFHLGPEAPPALDGLLAERGYVRNGATHLRCAETEAVAAAPTHDTVACHGETSPEWEAVVWPEATARPEVRRAIVGRIAVPTVYALACVDGEPAAAGLAVVERGWAGIYCMRTAEAHRRRGLGRAVLGALARAADAAGAVGLYLQVEQDNPGALALYRSAGFETAYDYHYRSGPFATDAA